MHPLHQVLANYKFIQWFVFVIACFIYANTIVNKWAVDDGIIVHQNSFVKQGVSGIGSILSTDAFAGFYGSDVNAVVGGRYRPLTPVIFAIQAELFASAEKDVKQKLERDKKGHVAKDLSAETLFPNILHFSNIIWYGLLCAVLYRTLLLVLNTDAANTNFIAAATAILYTVHPLHTEVVANIKGLDEILAMLCALLSLHCVFRAHDFSNTSIEKSNKKTTRAKWLFAAAGFFVLALLAKETAVTFIAVIPLSLWFFRSVSASTIAKLSLPLAIALLLFLGLRTAVLYQPAKGAIAEEVMNDPFLVLDTKAQYAPLLDGSDIEKLINPNAGTFTKMPYSNELATNFYTFGKYLKLLMLPHPLTVDYYPRHIAVKSFADSFILLSLLLHSALLTWALLNVRRKHFAAYAILYYFITFSIVSNLFFPIGTNMAERFMFMPSLGFCLLVAYFLNLVIVKFKLKKSIALPITYSAFAIVLMLMGFQSINRNRDWKNNLTLFSKDILVSQNSGKLNTDLAGEFIAASVVKRLEMLREVEDATLAKNNAALHANEQVRSKLLLDAVPLLKKGLEIHPMSNLTWLYLAKTQHFLGQMDIYNPDTKLVYLKTAIAAYDQADFYQAAGMQETINEYKALCLLDLGKLLGQQFGDIQGAIALLEQARQLAPNEAETYLLLGTAHSMLGHFQKAIDYTQQSLKLRPHNRSAKENLAVAYQIVGNSDATKLNLVAEAEKILLEVLSEEKLLPDNDTTKQSSLLRTLDLLYRNAQIRADEEKASTYKAAILEINPEAFNNHGG